MKRRELLHAGGFLSAGLYAAEDSSNLKFALDNADGGEVRRPDETTMLAQGSSSKQALHYPITANETAARITPTNYFFTPGNVLRYGADPTGAADAASAVQNAVDSSFLVLFPEGTYLVRTRINLKTGSSLIGTGNATLKTDGTNVILSAAGAVGKLAALTTNANRGDDHFSTATGTGLTYTAGNGFFIQSDARPLGRGSHKSGEIGVVASGSSRNVSVEHRILGDYLTTDKAKAAPVEYIEDVGIRGLTLTNETYASSPSTRTNPLVYFEFVRNFNISTCTFKENNSTGIAIFSCLTGCINNNSISRMRNDRDIPILGYGVQLGFSSQNIAITGNAFHNCRHAVTTGTGSVASRTPGYGIQRSIAITGNTVSNCTHAGLDTHEDSDGVTISGNTVIGCKPVGIIVRCYRATISGNNISCCVGKGIRVFSSAKDTVISANVISQIDAVAASADGFGIDIDGPCVTINGNRVTECARSGILINAKASQDINISGNTCNNNGLIADGDGITLVARSPNRVAIVGNVCTDNRRNKTQRYGLSIATGTTIVKNRILVAANMFHGNRIAPYNNAGKGDPMTSATGPDMSDDPIGVIGQSTEVSSINAGAVVTVTVALPYSLDAAANYSVIAGIENRSIPATEGLSVQGIVAKTPAHFGVIIKNNDTGPLRGTLMTQVTVI